MGITDKLKRTLNGQDEEEDDVGIMTTVCHHLSMVFFLLISSCLVGVPRA